MQGAGRDAGGKAARDKRRRARDAGGGTRGVGRGARDGAQAKALDEMLAATGEEVKTVLEPRVRDEALIAGIGGKWIHEASGRVYHTKYNPPKSFDGKSEPTPANMRDDETGEALSQRPDDTTDALPERLAAYHAETAPVPEHDKSHSCCRVAQVDSNMGPARKTEDIWTDCAKALGLKRDQIILMFGPPASSKGTHGGRLAASLGIPQLSTGDMLQEAVDSGTEIGLRVKSVMEQGQLVSDDILISIINERVKAADCLKGFILDGFPRTIAQAAALDEMLAATGEEVKSVLELSVLDAVEARWIHEASGRVYHTKYNPPKSFDGKSEPTPANMRDDETGEALSQRPDDTTDAFPERLAAYHAETAPVLEHYKSHSCCRVAQVDSNLGPARKTEDIWADCAKALGLKA
ncbi:adk [Symbiodinium sp. CCMP2592]|nr:adk [Symbiodinium sp. CCMP2592]